jgi:hypothetical protein
MVPPAAQGYADTTPKEVRRADELIELHRGLPLKVKEFPRPSPELARRLARHNAELALTGVEVLHAASARALCRHPLLRLDFRQMSLTDELVEILAAHEGILWIDGIALLSSSRAHVLARHNGPVFVADKTKIELPAADERLQERSFQSPILRQGLNLAGEYLQVRIMTTALAEAVVFFREGWLNLDALECLSPTHAELLGARGGLLSLNKLKGFSRPRPIPGELSPEAAAKLVAHAIAVPGTYIPSLIDDSSPWPPWTRHLRLNGLTRLRVKVARKFTHFRGILELNGIRTLEAEAAGCLATVGGEVHLKGLEDLDEETIRVLGPRKHILRLSPQLAKKLAK